MPQPAARRETRSERFRAFKIYRFLLMDREIGGTRAHIARNAERHFWTSKINGSPVEAAKHAGCQAEGKQPASYRQEKTARKNFRPRR